LTEVQKKLIRVMNELVHYYFNLHMDEVFMEIKQEEDRSSLAISGYPSVCEPDALKRLEKKLNKPRQPELEEYYWNLIGSVDSSEQMNMVSMLIDSAEVEYKQGKLTITVYRNH